MDGWINGWMDGWMGKCFLNGTFIHFFVRSFALLFLPATRETERGDRLCCQPVIGIAPDSSDILLTARMLITRQFFIPGTTDPLSRGPDEVADDKASASVSFSSNGYWVLRQTVGCGGDVSNMVTTL